MAEIHEIANNLKLMAEPPDVSSLDAEINAMASKMKKEALAKMAYIENQILSMATQIKDETISSIHSERTIALQNIEVVKSTLSLKLRESIKNINTVFAGVQKELILFIQDKVLENKELIADIQDEIVSDFKKKALSDIDRKKQEALEEIDNRISERTKKLKEIDRAEEPKKRVKKHTVEETPEPKGGVREHFVEGQPIESVEDVETLKKTGDPNSIL